MAGDDDESQSLLAKRGTIEERVSALETILDVVIQELKKLSHKIDDRGPTDGFH